MSGSVVVAVAQLDFVPAFSDAGRHLLSEPDFTPFTRPSSATLLDLELGIQEEDSHESWHVADAIREWRLQVRQSYESYIRHKVATILDVAAKNDVDILVFPEYSIPCDVLPLVADRLPNATVIAGTHTVEEECSERCKRLGFDIQDHDVGMAICPVFVGSARHTAHKLAPSRWEPRLVRGRPSLPITLKRNSTTFVVRVHVCIDFLEGTESESRHDDNGAVVIAVPAYTPDTSADFDDRALEYAKRRDHVVAIANAAAAGGSRIYYDGAHDLPMQTPTGTWTAAAGEELLIAARISPGTRPRNFTSIPTAFAPREQVAVVPLLYPSYNERDRALNELQQAGPRDVASVVLKHRATLATLRSPTMRQKFHHLTARQGGLPHEDVKRFQDFIIYPDDLPTLEEWRYRALLATARRFDHLTPTHAISQTRSSSLADLFRDAANKLADDTELPFSLQQVEQDLDPADLFAPWLTAATRLLALPSSGAVDTALAQWIANRLESRTGTIEDIRRAATLVTAARPYPVKRLWQRIEPILLADSAGASAARICREHDQLKRERGLELVQRASQAAIAQPGCHYLLYGFSHAVLEVLRAFAAVHGPTSLRLSVAECKNRLDVDSAPQQIARLQELGYKCAFVSNVSLAAYLERERVNAVFLGANAIVPDGILNTMGSLAMAILARHFQVPLVVMAASYKLWPRTVWHSENALALTMQRPEIMSRAISNVRAAALINYAYDVIPLSLISTLVSDRGVYLSHDEIAPLLVGGTDMEVEWQ